MPISVNLGQTLAAYGDPQKDIDPWHPAFQGRSGSFEPTRIDRQPMTSY